ncbi:MAG: NAD(P)-dependent oxidoreductase [Bryobacteraceae bacterium]|nr:NAD(P)-dependent oxidoreductase [Bryobacteraceae bacterium]
MPKQSLSRRLFVATAGAAPAAAAAGQAGGGKAKINESFPGGNAKADGPIKIVTMNKFEPGEVARLIAAAKPNTANLVICNDREQFRRELRDADVVYGDIRKADLDFAPKLRWMQAGGAGMEGADPAVMASEITITNMARIFAPGIAETAFGLLLCLTRGISKYYMPQFAKRTMNPVGTVKSNHYMELGGKTMGIVGMGGIGTEIARRAYYGFGMRVLATDAKPLPKPEYVAELHDPSFFERMVPQVDVLVSAAPHTKITDRMFNEQVFRSMKKTAIFLGMSRGRLFDDMALVKALKEGWIAGAGLDVMPVEPPPSDHPIFDCPNVVMSAHTSGWGPERQDRLIGHFAENIRRYSNGLPLMAVVDKAAGY